MNKVLTGSQIGATYDNATGQCDLIVMIDADSFVIQLSLGDQLSNVEIRTLNTGAFRWGGGSAGVFAAEALNVEQTSHN